MTDVQNRIQREFDELLQEFGWSKDELLGILDEIARSRPRHVSAFKLRYGLSGQNPMKYEDVGRELGSAISDGQPVKVERARQLVAYCKRLLKGRRFWQKKWGGDTHVTHGEMGQVDLMGVALASTSASCRLSVRARNTLRNLGVVTFQDAIALSEDDILRHPNAGMKTLHEIRTLLAEFGLKLKKGGD